MVVILKIHGFGLNNFLRELLLHETLELVRNGRETSSFKHRHCQGCIRDTQRVGSIGFYGGRIFTADVEHPLGKTHVHFIVDMDLLALAEDTFDPDAWEAPPARPLIAILVDPGEPKKEEKKIAEDWSGRIMPTYGLLN